MNKIEAIKEINETQDFYVSQLIEIITNENQSFNDFKEIDFTSPTGTGKTVMVAKTINKLPNYFFVVTTLSRGQLRVQIENKLKELCLYDNFIVYGLQEYTKTTILRDEDIIKRLPSDKPIIWFRDEGHIATNRWQEVLKERAIHIVNFSATNKTSVGIQCNFSHTMMLRTVTQHVGYPGDALDKLIEIKEQHKAIAKYNPCALFRVLNSNILDIVIKECQKRKLKYINITDEEFDMSDLCKDDNEYDVIINKFKITEGIDLKRCHVIYMDNKPNNESTVVQVIGRARRNALFWRDDIDILGKENLMLLEQTRQCHVFYNSEATLLKQSADGELSYTLCDQISVEDLKPNITIHVDNGQLPNGLYVFELRGKSGDFHITKGKINGYNVVDNNDYYDEELLETYNPYVVSSKYTNISKIFFKKNIIDYFTIADKAFDRCRYWFYVYKWAFPKLGLSADFDKWEKALKIEDEEKPVNVTTYKKMREEILSGNNGEIWKNGKIEPKEKDFFDIFLKSFVKNSFEYSEKVNIIDYSRKESGWSYELDWKIKPFIEKVEYIDPTDTFLIDSKLHDLKDKVVKLGDNHYLWNKKAYWSELLKYEITNLDELKNALDECKGTTFLKKGVKSFWGKIIPSLNTIYDLDKDTNNEGTLYDVIEAFNLKFSKNAVDNYLTSDRSSVDKDPYDNLIIHGMEDGKFVSDTEPWCGPSIYLLRSSFTETYLPYKKGYCNREISIIGPHKFRYKKGKYYIDAPVTSKITYFCKFNDFISKKYSVILEQSRNAYFKTQFELGFDRKANSCFGFCVEYFAKLKLYGLERYESYVEDLIKFRIDKTITDAVLVKAAMNIYLNEMKRVYGPGVSMLVIGTSISLDSLEKDQYKGFVKKVAEYGNKTCDYIKKTLYNNEIIDINKLHDPDLSVCYIRGMSDFITEDTILDVKCTGAINETYLKQVLSYHYLSKYRSDLKIKRVIVYDAITGRNIIVNL